MKEIEMLVDLTAHAQSVFIMLGVLILILGVFCLWARAAEDGKKIFPVSFGILCLVFGLFLSAGLGYVLPALNGKSPYKVVVQGVYQEATYHNSGGLFSYAYTVIHFNDGSTYLIMGRHNVPFSKNTTIVVEQNKRYLKIRGR
ncbi:MAG: hypothetical protein Q8P76_01770 [bacterium]|nr:hypothetical protein [bacterium]